MGRETRISLEKSSNTAMHSGSIHQSRIVNLGQIVLRPDEDSERILQALPSGNARRSPTLLSEKTNFFDGAG